MIEQITAGILLKISQNDEIKNREFLFKMKELEFYKSNFEKDLKDIFNYWFELVMLSFIKDNEHIDEKKNKELNAKFNRLLSIEIVSSYKMKTIKYGGVATSKILAIQNQMSFKQSGQEPRFAAAYVFCKILAVLKEDILGQKLDAMDIIKCFINDFDDYSDELKDAQRYIEALFEKSMESNN